MIKVRDLQIYNQDKCLISNLNIDFKCGELWAILGKNGVGKTTLLNTLAGFKQIKHGSITIDDVSLNSFSHLLKAQKISFLPQVFEASLNCTVTQNISYARYPWHKDSIEKNTNDKIIAAAISIMELQELRDKNIKQTSGGELKKVEIATILAQNSKIMMLDEPLNHLDLGFRIKLMQHLKQLSKNKIIIFITHDIQYVQEYCTNVMLIMNDKQTITGKTEQIMTVDNLNRMLGVSVPHSIRKILL